MLNSLFLVCIVFMYFKCLILISEYYNFFVAVSSFTKGEQMVPVLNECGTHCAVFGNHDFGKMANPLFMRSLVCMVFVYFYNIFLFSPFFSVNAWSYQNLINILLILKYGECRVRKMRDCELKLSDSECIR